MKMSARYAACLVLAIGTVACGGSGSSSNDASSASLSPGEIQDLATSGAAGDIAKASGVPEACVQLSLAMAAATGGAISGETAQNEPSVDSLEKSFEAIKSAAPDDLKSDVDTVAQALTSYYGILSEFDGDFSAMMTNPDAASRFAAIFDDENYAGAAERFSQWLSEVCSG